MRGLFILGYGVAAYILFLFSFLYFIFFLGNAAVLKSIDSAPVSGVLPGIVVNTCLVAVFCLQHLIMARSWFKTKLTRVIPESMERSTFVLAASVGLLLLCILWRPVPEIIWRIDRQIFVWVPWTGFILGICLVVYSTFLIDHWDLFGLRQVYLNFRNRPYNPVPFQVHSFYRYVRHPMMLGFLVLLWSAPVMTLGRLVLAAELTGFIFIGIWFEERELMKNFGKPYLDYREKTSMIIPKERRDPA